MKNKPPQSTPPNDAQVLQTWHNNAGAWTNAVRTGQIKSRLLVTNQAIIDAVIARRPSTVLDLGCGEGWLSGQLAARHLSVLGVDAVAALTQAARNQYGASAQFLTLSYKQLPMALAAHRFDLIVCNFSLLGKDDVASVLANLPAFLNDAGVILIQTLHPDTQDNVDGWRYETWQGIGDGFQGTAPWYYRTRDSWHKLFRDCNLQLIECSEPSHPQTHTPASIIFCLKPSTQVQ